MSTKQSGFCSGYRGEEDFIPGRKQEFASNAFWLLFLNPSPDQEESSPGNRSVIWKHKKGEDNPVPWKETPLRAEGDPCPVTQQSSSQCSHLTRQGFLALQIMVDKVMETLLCIKDRETARGKVLNIFLEAPRSNKMMSKIWEKKEIQKAKLALRALLPLRASVVGKRTARDLVALGQPDRARGTRIGVCGWPRPGVLTNVPHPAFGVGVCLSIKSKPSHQYSVKNLNLWIWSKVSQECWCPQAPAEVKEIPSGRR